TRLLLLSGIGTPYDPQTGRGVVGRNYSYQTGGRVQVFFEDREINPFIVGGAYIGCASAGAAPIKSKPVPHGTPRWGGEWKKAVAHNYRRVLTIGIHGSCQSYRQHYLDLDPTYRDSNGLPL